MVLPCIFMFQNLLLAFDFSHFDRFAVCIDEDIAFDLDPVDDGRFDFYFDDRLDLGRLGLSRANGLL